MFVQCRYEANVSTEPLLTLKDSKHFIQLLTSLINSKTLLRPNKRLLTSREKEWRK